ncbi:hypothetical protein BU15DRAFT_68928 [Melanogaster broomeanus]|nr:hypothetical protein BU15DRAFT_68928 [Melanogaster broomeanus]
MLAQLRDTFLGCFEDTQYGQPKLACRSRERAVACGRAFPFGQEPVATWCQDLILTGAPMMPQSVFKTPKTTSLDPNLDMAKGQRFNYYQLLYCLRDCTLDGVRFRHLTDGGRDPIYGWLNNWVRGWWWEEVSAPARFIPPNRLAKNGAFWHSPRQDFFCSIHAAITRTQDEIQPEICYYLLLHLEPVHIGVLEETMGAIKRLQMTSREIASTWPQGVNLKGARYPAPVGSGTGKPAGAGGHTRTRTRHGLVPACAGTGFCTGQWVTTHRHTRRGYTRGTPTAAGVRRRKDRFSRAASTKGMMDSTATVVSTSASKGREDGSMSAWKKETMPQMILSASGLFVYGRRKGPKRVGGVKNEGAGSKASGWDQK